MMVHNENIKTFKAISKSPKMEDEHHKLLPSSSVAFGAKGSKLTSKRPFNGK